MNKSKEEELLEWLDEKVDNYNDPAYQQIKELIKKPEVTKEFVEKWLGKLGGGGGGHGYPTFWEALEAMLKEAGVEVIND